MLRLKNKEYENIKFSIYKKKEKKFIIIVF